MKAPPTALTGAACGRTNAATKRGDADRDRRCQESRQRAHDRPAGASPGAGHGPGPCAATSSPMVSGATSTEEAPGSSAGYSSCAW